ncbi:hypothetical protein BDP27DRAFT_1232475, partial [Rhodocollybia butyracea]
VSNKFGGGSLAGLPIIETQVGDALAYIPTSVFISNTDGQIFLEAEWSFSPLSMSISWSLIIVSKCDKMIKKFASSLKFYLTQYYEVAAFNQFGPDLDASTCFNFPPFLARCPSN